MEEHDFDNFYHFTVKGRVSETGEPVELQATPDNAELYIHHEDYEEVDHVFVRINPTVRALGAFLWKSVLNEDFEPVVEAMIESGNWVVVYRPVPTDADFAQYAHDHTNVPDELPPDFM